MPSHTTIWDGEEYKKSVEVLRNIAGFDPTQLPRLGSTNSGEVFARMTSSDNLVLAKNKSLGFETRALALVPIAGSLAGYLRIYAAETSCGFFDDEVVEVMRTELEVMKAIVLILEERFAAATPDEAANLKGSPAFRKIQDGFNEIFEIVVSAIVRKKPGTSKLRLRTASYFVNVLPELRPIILPAMAVSLKQRILAALASETDPEMKQQLSRIEELLAVPAAL